jgi:HKD family nuclease
MEIRYLENSIIPIEFENLCLKYSVLKISTAWCGDPKNVFPFSFLNTINNKLDVKITTGTFFNQTHPDSIQFFLDHKIDIKIFKTDGNLFHPKLYFFKGNNGCSIIIGSSNFTYNGFYSNIESNMLLEFTTNELKTEAINEIENKIDLWHSNECSFIPTINWLNKYRESYEDSKRNEKNNGLKSARNCEETISATNWLESSNWALFYDKVQIGLKLHKRDVEGYIKIIDAVTTKLPLPWTLECFNDIDNRRIMYGEGNYGWLGHVGASGVFKNLIGGNDFQAINKRILAINELNEIFSFKPPLDYELLKFKIDKLVALGNSMRVWGRILAIVKPDIYCTISNNNLIKNWSKTLGLTQKVTETTEGYVKILKLIHGSPWYNSVKPFDQSERMVWNCKVAFLDAVLL